MNTHYETQRQVSADRSRDMEPTRKEKNELAKKHVAKRPPDNQKIGRTWGKLEGILQSKKS